MDDVHEDALRLIIDKAEAHATRHVPIIRRHLHLLSVNAQLSVGGFDLVTNDTLGFMAVHFFDKQVRHAQAVLKLGDHLDTALIVRSMMEGLCFLKWASHEPTRHLRWRLFAFVAEWRHLTRLPATEREAAAGRIAELRRQLDPHVPRLYSNRALDALKRGGEIPRDPYIGSWHNAKLSEVFAAVKAEDLYTGPYAFTADWHHWSPAGLQIGMDYRGGTLKRVDRSPVLEATSLSTAFQCLVETAGFTAAHFKLPVGLRFERALKDLENELDSASS